MTSNLIDYTNQEAMIHVGWTYSFVCRLLRTIKQYSFPQARVFTLSCLFIQSHEKYQLYDEL